MSLYELLLERNNRETKPFVSIHEAYATLLNQVDALQSKCEAAEREISSLQQQNEEAAANSAPSSSKSLLGGGSKASSAAATAALKNEARLRDKLEKLQEELNSKLKREAEDQAEALKTAKHLSEMKDLNTAQERTLANLKEENERAERAIEHLTNEVNDAKSRTELAEKQYEGLKSTIRLLQNENDKLKKENHILEERLVADKGKTVEEMNVLNDMVNALKMEVDMLRTYKVQEEKRSKSWFGGGGAATASGNAKAAEKSKKGKEGSSSRKWGSFGVILPSSPKHTIQSAHSMEGTCVMYDDSGMTDLVATASSDSTVKVWDTNSGSVRATLRGTSGHSIIGCDLQGSFVVGAGSDKTCRVWNLRTERMIHHLVGHAHKVTCVRFVGSAEKGVITGSADRSLKIWDISRKTYRQTVTLRHSSTSNCVDVGSDTVSAVSGHLDGGLRFWDLRSGERTADISTIHEGGITSVQFDPMNSTQVLTNSVDSTCKIVDIRTNTAVHTLRAPGFVTSHGWSKSCFSPDGNYIIAGSNSSKGDIFIWNSSDGSLKAKLSGYHTAGVCGIHWGRGGSSGQQVASIDRKGVLILWA